MAQGWGNYPGSGGITEIVYDGEVPRSFTGYAKIDISGGQFVTGYAGATENIIGSVMGQFSTGSIVIGLLVDSDHIVGVAMHNVDSGLPLGVATRGQFIATCGDAISGGVGIYAESGVDVGQQCVKAMPIDISYSGTQIGRAITNADSGTHHYVLANFDFV